jgi:hypothetical protein
MEQRNSRKVPAELPKVYEGMAMLPGPTAQVEHQRAD